MKKFKILIIALLSIVLLLNLNVCYAAGNTTAVEQKTLGDMITGADGFIKKADEDKIDQDNLNKLSSTIYNVLLVLAIVVSVLVGAILGIKLMMTGAEGKADVKQSLLPYLVGNIVVFGAFAIWKIVVLILNQVQ